MAHRLDLTTFTEYQSTIFSGADLIHFATAQQQINDYCKKINTIICDIEAEISEIQQWYPNKSLPFKKLNYIKEPSINLIPKLNKKTQKNIDEVFQKMFQELPIRLRKLEDHYNNVVSKVLSNPVEEIPICPPTQKAIAPAKPPESGKFANLRLMHEQTHTSKYLNRLFQFNVTTSKKVPEQNVAEKIHTIVKGYVRG